MSQQTKDLGLNPFSYLAKRYSTDGTQVTMLQALDGQWVDYEEIDNSATYTLKTPRPEPAGQTHALSTGCPIYLWNRDKGYENFSTWIE